MDDKFIDNVIRILQTVGFPVAVAVWFMFRTDKRIEDNSKAQNDLTQAVNKMLDRMDTNK